MKKQEIIFKNDRGFIFKRITRKEYVEVKLYDNNSTRAFHVYSFPNVKLDYDRTYLNWENLSCCATGWHYDKNYLYNAVQSNKKLYAGLFIKDSSDVKLEDLVANRDDVFYGEEANAPYSEWKYICKKGCVADYIDIDNILENYKRLGIDLNDFGEEKETLIKMCNEEINIFSNLKNKYNYNYRNTSGIAQTIFTGLLLGYPIESTVSFLGFY